MNKSMTTELTPEHHLMAIDYVTEGLNKKQIADKYSVTVATVIRVSQSDEWGIVVKGLLKEIKGNSVNAISRLAKKSIKVIEEILGDSMAKNSDKLKAASSVLDRVITKGQVESGKIVLNMVSPAWGEKEGGGGKGGGGNNIQIVLSDREYKK